MPKANNEAGLTRRSVLQMGAMAGAGVLFADAASQGQTGGSKGPNIDVHAHVWDNAYLDMVESYGKKDVWVQRNKGAGPDNPDMEKRFAQMDKAGVDMQILSICPQAPYFADKNHAVTAARKANDMYAEVVRRWPKRFKAFAALPMPHVDEALKELTRAMDQLKMVGVATTTSILGRSIADPAWNPIYEELNRRGSILYIHPAGVSADSDLIANFKVTWMIGAPIEDTISAAHLIVRGVPKRYPNMKIINSHLGGALPMMIQRMDNISTWENPDLPEKPSVLAKRMYYDTVGHGWVPALKAAVESFGAERLVLGTDFPYEAGPLFQRAIDYIKQAGLSQEQLAQILSKNAMAMLGMRRS